jgi:small subunit ribosomal protein S16
MINILQESIEMSLKMRLARGGAKKRPFFRIVVADGRSPRDGRFIERLGHYNPLLPRDHPERLKFDLERVKYWLGKGAQPTERIRRFLADAKLMTFTQPERPKKSLPRKKARERLAAAKGEAPPPAAEASPTPAESA